MKLGSLFDGIGGFPLAAVINGIIPVWASEIEAAPISITKLHFPDMKHLGDITKISGAEIEPVDFITFGSPCQDLSLAGKRQGLSGERSGLFIEAIRIIKEMRGKTDGEYPRRIIWENVTGAFSSNKGEDFRIVLEEIANVAGGGAISIPRPPARDNSAESVWEYAGAIMGNGWSLAWRVLDAQYWGVPQRRKRIFLVADFAGERAATILFKPDGLQGDSAESEKKGKRNTPDIKRGFGETGVGYWQQGIQCLRAEGENRPSRPSNVIVEKSAGFNGWRSITGSIEYKEDSAPCMQTKMPPNVVYGMATKQQSQNIEKDISPPILANDYKPNCVFVDGFNQNITGDIAPTLRGQRIDASNIGLVFENHGQDSRISGPLDISPTISQKFGTGGNNVPLVLNDQCGNKITVEKDDISPTLRVEAHGDMPVVAFEPGVMSREGGHIYDNIAGTLRANAGDNQLAVFCIQGSMIGRDDKNGPQGDGINENVCFTLNTIDRHAVAIDCRNHNTLEEISAPLQAKEGQSLNYINPIFTMQGYGDYKETGKASTIKSRDGKDSTDSIATGFAVRRLTPLECERLQGFPDGWTEYGINDLEKYKKYRISIEGKERIFLPEKTLLSKISDSKRYKALGNSVAIPCVDFLMGRISGGLNE